MASSVIHPSPPKYLDKELLQTALENYLCCNEVKINKFEVKTLVAGSGENYCSDIYQITMKYQLLDGEMEEQEENVVVKSMPKHKQLVLKNLQIYNRELYFYRNILPKMETIMKIIGKNYILGPRLLYNVSKPIETLIFQNLIPLGFKLQSRQNGLDKIHSLMVLQKLAQYHALSLSLNERDDYLFSNILQRYPFGLLNMDSCKSDAFKALFGGQLLKLIEILKKDSDLKTETINKLDNYYSHFTERVLKSVYPLKGQLNVLNHGDLWVNNLMFCYDSKDTERPKEDLGESKFEMASREKGLDLKHCLMVMNKLGKFHAASLKLFKKVPEYQTCFHSGMLADDALNKDEGMIMTFFGNNMRALIDLTETWKGYEKITGKMKKYERNLRNNLRRGAAVEENAFCVLNHGDLWVNNILFKYDDQRNLVDLNFVDFQMSVWNSPGIDLNYFFYTSLELDILKNKLDLLIKEYHKSLSETMQDLGYKKIPSYYDIYNEVQKRQLYGFFAHYGVFPVICQDKEQSHDSNLENFKNEDFAKQKLKQVFASKRLQETYRYTLEKFDKMGIFD